MTKEIQGLNDKDSSLATEVAFAGAEIAVRKGVSESQAFTAGIKTAQYAGELTFTALRHMGIIAEEGIDAEVFRTTVNRIVEQTIRHS